jgi:hypothetical protein
LHLLADKDLTARLQGELVHVDLDDRPIYSALSYVWGDQSDRVLFVCDGVEITVGKSLGQALKHLRQATGPPVVLWVDAICINQRKISEKNHQVALMKDIYWFAKKTVVWLGLDGNENAKETFDNIVIGLVNVEGAINNMMDLGIFFRQNHVSIFENTSGVWNPIMIGRFIRLLKSEYFSRTWIIQEIGLSRQPIAYWGEETINFNYIGLLSMILLQYRYAAMKISGSLESVQRAVNVYRAYRTTEPQQLYNVIQGARSNLSGDSRDKVYAFLSHPAANANAGTFPDYRNRMTAPSLFVPGDDFLYGRDCSEVEKRESLADEERRLNSLAIILSPDGDALRWSGMNYLDNDLGPETSGVVIAKQLLNSTFNESTSHRTYRKGETFLKPDYNDSVVTVYRDLTMQSIQQTHLLEILSLVQHKYIAPNGPDFPSWIPRWDKPTETSVLGIGVCDLSFAIATGSAFLMPSIDPGALTVKGIFYDKVAFHTALLHREDFTDSLKTNPVFAMANRCGVNMDLSLHGRLPSIDVASNARMKAYLQTWTAGRQVSATSHVPSDGDLLELDFAAYHLRHLQSQLYEDSPKDRGTNSYAWSEMVRHLQIVDQEAKSTKCGDPDRFAEAAATTCNGRKFFLTENGFFGIGPAVTEIGDAVYVLLGAYVPLLLRPKNRYGRVEEDGSWSLVGECYVDSLLMGDTLRAARALSSKLEYVTLW